MKKIDIIIPCYNEEKNIKLIFDELNKVTEQLEYEFKYLFINDGSKDLTKDEVKKLRPKNRVKLLDFSRNYGKEAALLAGLDYSDADATIIIDADLQMPVAYILEMIEKWENGTKLVLTSKARRSRGLKSFLAKKYYMVHNSVTHTNILQDALDFQLMDRQVVNSLQLYREKTRFFKGITGSIGYDYEVIKIEIKDRENGSSSFSSFNTLFNYAFVGIAANSTFPLILGVYAGIIVSLSSFLYIIFLITQTLVFGIDVPGYASTISFISFFSGLILIILGIIGYYIGLIYEEVKCRPNYIIREDYDGDE